MASKASSKLLLKLVKELLLKLVKERLLRHAVAESKGIPTRLGRDEKVVVRRVLGVTVSAHCHRLHQP